MSEPSSSEDQQALQKQWEPLLKLYKQGKISRRQFVKLGLAVGGAAALTAAGTSSIVQKVLAQGLEPQVLIYAADQDIPTIDPSDRTDYSIGAVSRQIYDRLFRFEGGWPAPVEPGLASKWEASPDAREWIFHLTDQAKFHDGTLVTAEAVKFSYERTLRMKKQRSNVLQPYLDETGSVEVMDDHTVRMTLKTPFGDFPRLLAFQEQGIVNPKQVRDHERGGDEGAEWLRTHEAGSGPFTLKSWRPEISTYEFEAVPDYWQGWPGEGHLAGFVWRVIGEPTSRRLALLSGEADIADVISVDDLAILKNDPRITTQSNAGLLAGYVKLNNTKPPTSDPNFRRFLAYAFDYQAIEDFLLGTAPLMVGPIPQGVDGHDPEVQPLYRHDLNKAREYLDKTPWKDGGVEVDYVYVTGLDFEEQVGLILLDQLRRFNIKVNLVPKIWPDMVASCAFPETGPHMINIFVQSAPIPDLWFVEQFYSPNWDRETGGSFQTCEFYKSPTVNTLIEKLLVTTDTEARLRIIRGLQQLVMEDVPSMPLFVISNNLGFRKRVQGYEYFGDISVDFWRLWIDDSKERA